MDKVNQLADQMGLSQLEKFKPLKNVADKVGLKVGQLAVLVGLVLMVLMLFEFGSCLICDVIGFIYPAYMSFKALESKTDQDDKTWLTYWVVYSFMHIYNITLGRIMTIVPFYDLIRLCFYIYLFHPSTLGAVQVYDKIIRPIMKQYEGSIDSKMFNIKNQIDDSFRR